MVDHGITLVSLDFSSMIDLLLHSPAKPLRELRRSFVAEVVSGTSIISSPDRLEGVAILTELSSLYGALWLRSTKLSSMVESHQGCVEEDIYIRRTGVTC